MGYAEAAKMHDQIKTVFDADGLSLKKLIMLATNGPNVKTVFKHLGIS